MFIIGLHVLLPTLFFFCINSGYVFFFYCILLFSFRIFYAISHNMHSNSNRNDWLWSLKNGLGSFFNSFWMCNCLPGDHKSGLSKWHQWMCKKDWDVFRDVPLVNPYRSNITGVQSCSWRPNVLQSSDATHPAWKFFVSSWGLLLFGSGVLNWSWSCRNRISHPCLRYKNIFTLLPQLAEYEK